MQERWQPVQITLLTEEEESPLRITLTGSALRRGDAVLLQYQEHMTDDAADDTQVRLQIRAGRVMMMRSGPFTTHLVFVAGQRHESSYHTPFGDLPLVVDTHAVVTRVEEADGECMVDYELTIQGSETTHRVMRIAYAFEAAE